MTARCPRKTLWVIALDGEKALLFENEGDREYPVLRPIDIDKQDVPPSRDLVTDKPGRMFDGGANQRSAMEQVDAHDQEETRFARDAIEMLNEAALKDEYGALLIYAAARTLGKIRPYYHDELQKRLVGEFDLDVVNEPVDALEKRVAKAFATD